MFMIEIKSKRGDFTSFSIAIGMGLLSLIMCLVNECTHKLLLAVISWSIPYSQGEGDGI